MTIGERERNGVGDDVGEKMEKRGGEENGGCSTVADGLWDDRNVDGESIEGG